jgi:hypothetical protein
VAWLPFLLLILLVCLSAPNESRPAASEKRLFLKEKLGPEATIANAVVERKEKTAKITGKTHFFFGHVQNAQRSCGNARSREPDLRSTGLWYPSESLLNEENRG